MQEAFITPAVLRWAREQRGRSVEDVAQALGLNPDDLAAWENGSARPEFGCAERLAAELRCPFGFLFLSKPPPFGLDDAAPSVLTDADLEAMLDNQWRGAGDPWEDLETVIALVRELRAVLASPLDGPYCDGECLFCGAIPRGRVGENPHKPDCPTRRRDELLGRRPENVSPTGAEM